MLLKTRHFGEIEINEKNIITFDEGIPGFTHVRKFIILDTENTGGREVGEKEAKKDTDNNNSKNNFGDETESLSPFRWLQCVDDPDLAFVIVNPFEFKPDYEVELSIEITKLLKIEKEEDVALYAIVVVPEDITRMTMNLQAPLVINVKSKKGVQTILNTEKYSVRHYIMDEIARQEVKANACTDKKKGSVHYNRR